MEVAVTGASGLIGGALCARLQDEGHTVLAVTRGGAPEGTERVPWRGAASGEGDWALGLRGVDAVVYLAGSSIGAGRWTAARKREIRESRVEGTRALLRGLRRAGARPKAFLSMSAVGYYGPQDKVPLTESDPPGDDFLAKVCAQWEEAAEEAAELGARVARLRAGIVLAREGGVLERMAMPFRLGVGGPIGSGRQWVSWIAREDVIGIILLALRDERAEGAINLTAPAPVRNLDFARALGEALKRPSALRLPASAVRLAFGEMGEALLLSGQPVLPERALSLGYVFGLPEIGGALRRILRG